jgi:hypothetical protein
MNLNKLKKAKITTAIERCIGKNKKKDALALDIWSLYV